MFRIVPRTEIGLPALVTNSNGSPRPPMWAEPKMTAHYTGNNVDYTDKVTVEVVLQIQRIFGKTKPFEYNYVIGQEENDEIYEFAGKFQAAHSAGENSISFGVLFLLGVGEEPTPLMIQKWRWLREVLQYTGYLSPFVTQLPHSQEPGAATACPGEVHNYMDELRKPFVQPLPPVGDKDMIVLSTPLRIFDSRSWGNPFAVGSHRMPLNAFSEIPATASALFLTITAVAPSQGGFITLWDGSTGVPNVSNLNYASGQVIANTTITRVANRGFSIYVSNTTHLIFDVVGYQ